MAVSIFLRLRLALVLLIGACRPDPSPQAPTAPVGGTYRVIFTTDSSQVTAQLEIQSAADSVTWGQLTYPDSDREGVVLDSVSGDSLYLRLGFTGLMVLARAATPCAAATTAGRIPRPWFGSRWPTPSRPACSG